MRHVGVREFRNKATGWLKGSEPLAVERYGKIAGLTTSSAATHRCG